MANQEQLNILKQGVDVWHKWREKNQEVIIDLTGADLRGTDLSHADLSGAYLEKADLRLADLSHADLSGAYLGLAYLMGADLSDATLDSADLGGAYLSHATFNRAHLGATLLCEADLNEADLISAFLTETNLSEAVLYEAYVGYTVFGDVDLSTVKGLETMLHFGPSIIGIDTIIRSQGKIPEVFLKEAGVPPSIIEAIPSLVSSLKPIDFYSCFISYSSKDQEFAERLYADLQAKGVRCWLDKEDLKIGEKFRPRIDEAIRQHDKLLLVLSQHSVRSSWVETEVETAFEKERRYKKLVLFPIKLDDVVMRTRQAWAADIRRQRHIGDFTCWKDHDTYQKAFTRLLRDLKSEAQKMGSGDMKT